MDQVTPRNPPEGEPQKQPTTELEKLLMPVLNKLADVVEKHNLNVDSDEDQDREDGELPIYISFDSDFLKWATQFKRYAKSQLKINDDQTIIKKAIDQLDGMVQKIAKDIARETNNWENFALKVNRQLGLHYLSLRQSQVPNKKLYHLCLYKTQGFRGPETGHHKSRFIIPVIIWLKK